MVRLPVFSRVRHEARAWMKAPNDEVLSKMASLARDATAHVPQTRRADWEKLLAGFGVNEDPLRRTARVEGLVRACTLFEREERLRERRAGRLEWEQPVEDAEGLGPTSRKKLAEHGVAVVSDLLWTLPVGWDDLRAPLGVAEAIAMVRTAGESLSPAPRQCIRGVVRSAALVPMRPRRAVRVVVADARAEAPAALPERGPNGEEASLDAWWFFAAHGVLAAARSGTPCVLVGRLRVREGKRPSMAHPDIVRADEIARGLRPRYGPLGVAPGTVRRAIRDAVARTSPLPDPVPADVVTRESMPDAQPLLQAVHGARLDVAPEHARRALADRLAWVEAFTRVWQRLLTERLWDGALAPRLPQNERAAGRVVDELGFALTDAQRRAMGEIARDLESPGPMRRLLLGDVGTGKTAVALAAAAQCVAAGCQCAMLVPTGLLAEQYLEAAAPLVRALGVRLELVTAGMSVAQRRMALAAVASGETQVVVGTHALLEHGVTFARLGLVVVDEQQRLGVAQRLTLVRKGQRTRPHLLSLSATPIPRTLALALRGELSTSVLDERPRGRGLVATELRARGHLDAVFEEVLATVARGERVFFVCPRIEDDEDEEEIGVEARAEHLARWLAPGRVVVVHGAMAALQRNRAMSAFRRGEAQVLVGTTVVEVGLDVPDATLMVVDGAERFGLAQLHQLRGRVGRGARPGKCLLVHDELLLDLPRRRLETLVRTNDGVEIARADLALRGAGDLGGTRQSGVAEDFVWLDPSNPPAWIERIESDARRILGQDPELAAPEHRALALAVRRFVVAVATREEAG
jgi:ATP-dependent DNA helicase RecG